MPVTAVTMHAGPEFCRAMSPWMKRAVPSDEMKSCERPDVYVAGSGSPLLLLHGLTATWHVWKPLLPTLTARHRVIALTLPGHAGTGFPPDARSATVAGLADAIIERLRARGIDTAHVVGNSLGGWLAIELARRGFARSVTALSPAGGWQTLADYDAVAMRIRLFHRLMPFLLLFMALFAWIAPLRRWLAADSMTHGERMPFREFLRSCVALVRTRVLLPLLASMRRDGPCQPLAAAVAPIRIVWAADDRVIPLARYGEPLYARIPHAERVVLDGIGHVPMYDDAQALCACILDLTARVDAASQTGPAR